MIGLSTGRYSVIRGTDTENEYGDTVSDNAVVEKHLSGSIIERTRTNFDPQSGRIATLRQLTGRFANGTGIQDGDRLRDERSGEVFLVTSVYRGTSVVGKADLVLDLSHA